MEKKFKEIEKFIVSMDRNSLEDEQQALLMTGGAAMAATGDNYGYCKNGSAESCGGSNLGICIND